MSILVLGSLNVDLVIRSARLPRPGETVLGGEFFQAIGGKGANQAVAAARAGLGVVTFIATLGDDDHGAQALAALRQERLDLRHVRSVPGTPTGVALIFVDAEGENCISVARGANSALTADEVQAIADSTFSSANVFLTQCESPLDAVLAGMRRARQAGLTTILNPAPALPLAECHALLALTDVLTPNEHEAALLTGLRVNDVNSAIGAAHWLQRSGPNSVVITLGKIGAVAVHWSEVDVIPAAKVAAIDATGAGDAFNGALAVAISEGKSLFAAAHWATIAGGLTTTKLGAMPSLPTRDAIDRHSRQ